MNRTLSLLTVATLFVFSPMHTDAGEVYPGTPENHDIDRANQHLHDVRERHGKLVDDLRSATAVVEQHTQRHATLAARLATSEEQLTVLDAALIACSDEEQRCRLEHTQKMALLETTSQRYAELVALTERLEQQVAEIKNQLTNRQDALARVREQISVLKPQTANACRIRHQHSPTCRSVERDLENGKNKQRRLMQRIAQLKSEYARRCTELDGVNAERNRLANERSQLRLAMTKLKRDADVSRRKHADKRHAITQMRRDIDTCRAELVTVQRDVEIASRRCEQLSDRITRADRTLHRTQRYREEVVANYRQAKRHLTRTAERLGRQGGREGRELAAQHAERDARTAGSEIGRRYATDDGIATARMTGAVTGKQRGRAKGSATGRQLAADDAQRDGPQAAWAERGFADGEAAMHRQPNVDDRRYVDAYRRGQERAFHDAYVSHYHHGVHRADSEYDSATLTLVQRDGRDTAPFSQLPVDRTPRGHVAESAFSTTNPYTRNKLPVRPLFARQGKTRVVQPSIRELAGHDAYHQTPDINQPVRRLDTMIANLPTSHSRGEEQTWTCQYFVNDALLYPSPALQQMFERAYRDAYIRTAVDSYDVHYSTEYHSAVRRYAVDEYEDVFQPGAYDAERQIAEVASFNYWQQRSELEAYEANYANAYERAYDNAYRLPDRSHPIYESARRDGEQYALDVLGFERGHHDVKPEAEAAESERGYADKSAFFSNNAVIEVENVTLIDDNEDGIFAPGEAFSVSVVLTNIGLRSPQLPQLGATFQIVRGPAQVIADARQLPEIPAQSRTTVTHALAGRVSPAAAVGDIVELDVAITYMRQTVARKTLRLVTQYPLQFSEVVTAQQSLTNGENRVTAQIRNMSTRTAATSIVLRVRGSDDEIADGPMRTQRRTLNPGERVEITFSYAVDDALLFDTAVLQLSARDGDRIQAVPVKRTTSVTKRYRKESDVLLYSDDFGAIDFRRVRNAFTTLGVPFDVYDRKRESLPIDDRILSRYTDGFVLFDRNEFTTDEISSIRKLLDNGGDILLGLSEISDTPARRELMAVFGIERCQLTPVDAIDGDYLLMGERYHPGVRTALSFDAKRRTKQYHNYSILAAPKRGLFGRTKTVALRHTRVHALNAATIVGVRLANLPVDALTRLVVLSYFAKQPVLDNVECFVQSMTDSASMLPVIQHQLIAEIDKDRAEKNRLYNRRHGDVTQTQLYQFQHAVLRYPDNFRTRQLIELAVPISKRLRSRHGEKMIGGLKAAQKRQHRMVAKNR